MHARLALILAVAVATTACSSTTQPDPGDAAKHDESYLFVQTCTGGTLEGNTLTMQNVGPTLYFTDRPYRVEGHVATPWLLKQWDKGSNSFASDPPNAVLSVLSGTDVKTTTLILTEPRLVGSNLTYTIERTEGAVPASFGDASLFIDNFRGGSARMGGRGVRRSGRGPGYYHRYGGRRVVVDGDQDFTDLGTTGPAPPHLGL